MRFSPLQQYILKECRAKRGTKVGRVVFSSFYIPDHRSQTLWRTQIITRSLERLIDRGLLVGYGVRTPRKWFIKEVKMTAAGRREWLVYLNRRQKKLPLSYL